MLAGLFPFGQFNPFWSIVPALYLLKTSRKPDNLSNCTKNDKVLTTIGELCFTGSYEVTKFLMIRRCLDVSTVIPANKHTLYPYLLLLPCNCLEFLVEVSVMQIEKALIKNRLRVSKVSWKFRIPAAYDFAVIYPWN